MGEKRRKRTVWERRGKKKERSRSHYRVLSRGTVSGRTTRDQIPSVLYAEENHEKGGKENGVSITFTVIP